MKSEKKTFRVVVSALAPNRMVAAAAYQRFEDWCERDLTDPLDCWALLTVHRCLSGDVPSGDPSGDPNEIVLAEGEFSIGTRSLGRANDDYGSHASEIRLAQRVMRGTL